MIRPSIGRVLLIQNRDGLPKSSQPEPALVTYVHDDRTVNVGGFGAHGNVFALQSLTLLQDDDQPPENKNLPYAEWMPFQKQAASKEERLIGGTTEPSALSSAADPVADPKPPAATITSTAAGDKKDAPKT